MNFDITGEYKHIISEVLNLYNNDPTNQRLGKALDILNRKEYAIAFSGFFKSGKSSLLNFLLNREILPVSRTPETGVLCELTSGKIDTAKVFYKNGLRHPISCNMESIEEVCSLSTSSGTQQREKVSSIAYLAISLQNTTIKNDFVWQDTPGAEDDEAMNYLAQKAAENADVIVWILSSKNFVSMSERKFFSQILKERGKNGLVIAINTFLDEDTEEDWQKFRSGLPFMMNRLKDFEKEIGVELPPPFIFSLKSKNISESRVNRSLFVDKINEIQKNTSLVRYLRLRRIVSILQEIVQKLSGRINEELLVYENKMWEHNQVLKQIDNVQKFKADLQLKCETYIQSLNKQIKTIGQSKSQLTTLNRDFDYTSDLKKAIELEISKTSLQLFSEIGKLMKEYGINYPSSILDNVLKKTLIMPNIYVYIPKHEFNYGNAAKGLLGIVFGPWAAAATTAATVGAEAARIEKLDREGTEANITVEANKVANYFTVEKCNLYNVFLSTLTFHTPDLSTLVKPNASSANVLIEKREKVKLVIQQVEKLIQKL